MSDNRITLTSQELEAAMEAAIRRAQEPPPSKLEAAKARLTQATAELAEIGGAHGMSAGDVLAAADALYQTGETVQDWEEQ